MTTSLKVRWTSHQRQLVVAAILSLLKDQGYKPPFKGARVSTETLKPLVARAQVVLDASAWKPSFSKDFLFDLATDVTAAKDQHDVEEAMRQSLLSQLPVERLISELAGRQVGQVTEQVYQRLKVDLFDAFSERLSRIEQALGMTPDVARPASVARTEVPHFVLVGLLSDQVRSITDEFSGKATFKCVKDVGPCELRAAVTDKVVLVSAFVSHSEWNTCKVRAKEAHFVKHIRDIKPIIRAKLSGVSNV